MTKLSDRFGPALAYAFEIHDGQMRKGTGIAYISHLLGVTSIALEHGASEDEAIGALLHDAAEDAGGAPVIAEIQSRFGEAVADIVAGCSDTFETPKPPWRERKESYIVHLKKASASVLLVSAADKLHNVRSIASDYREVGDAVWGRFDGRRVGTLWYYRALADSFLELMNGRLAGELNLAVRDFERATSAS